MVRLAILAAALSSTLALAEAKTFQVTGPVLEIKDDVIVVEKGKEKWELNKGTAKVEGGELKVGAKVTIMYTMTAQSIEVKPDKAAKGKK